MSAITATREILEHNALTKVPASFEAAAIARMKDAMRWASENPGGPDLMIKAFHDLDSVFFRGVLRHDVTLRWNDDKDFKDNGITNKCWGRTAHPKRGQSAIFLNATLILLERGWQPFNSHFVRSYTK